MANRYWVGGSATWSTATTPWSATSGGAGGATAPTSADDVFFDQASTYTVTLSGTIACNSMTVSAGTVTFAGSGPLTINGSLSLVAATVWSATGALTFGSSATGRTITTNGVSLSNTGGININAASGSLTLGSSLTTTGTLTITAGTFNTGNFAVNAFALSSSNSNARTINLGSSTVTLTAAAAPLVLTTKTNLTLNAGTSTIALSGAAAPFAGNSLAYYNLSFTNTTAGTSAITGANTFNNITVTAPAAAGFKAITFDSAQTLTGGLFTSGTAGNRRVLFKSATFAIAETLTVGSAGGLVDADFQDLYVIGTAAPISGTRVGDLRGCRGITFSAPKTVYWNLTGTQSWSANAWAATSGGTPSTDNFPLGQDTAVFDNAGAATSVSLDTTFGWVPTVNSQRTNAFTLSVSATTVYGDWTSSSGIGFSGAGPMTFAGRNTQTINTNAKAFNFGLVVDSLGGTVQLASALTGSSFTVTNGTFSTQNNNMSLSSLVSTGSGVRAINLGSSAITCSSAFTLDSSPYLTFNAGTSSISFSNTATLTTGGKTFYDFACTSTAGAATTISGGGTFNSISITPTSTAGMTPVVFTADTTTNSLTIAGSTILRRIFARSDVIGAQRVITVNSSISANNCDFRDIYIGGAVTGVAPNNAGDCGGNSGITFPASKTVYWNLTGTANWSATGWATSIGGTPALANFPLAQDTAVFDNTGAATTLTIDNAWNIGTINASTLTGFMTLTLSAAPTVYGNLTFGSSNITTTSVTFAMLFSGRGTQTITSNGASFQFPVTIDSATGTVQLGDAMTIIAARTLTLRSGTFDAVSYNVSAGLVSLSATTTARTLRMGSGTWTLSGIGTVWGAGTPTGLSLFKGTANIVLSDTTTSARTFAGGGLSYNKLTIGGVAGSPTISITGDNTFTELASIKTVAYTIALGTTTQTFGKWTVTGTVGNVVTLTGTGTSHVLAGNATSGINYLAMGSIGFSATSPGEFYAGANSTGTAGAPVYRTAPPAGRTLYWVGGVGSWSSTAKWSLTSGGAGGAAVPTSLDIVNFNSASAGSDYNVTIDVTARCNSIQAYAPATGTVNFIGTANLIVHDAVWFDNTGVSIAGFTGPLTLAGSATGKSIATGATNTVACNIEVNGVGSGWSLATALQSPGGNTLTVTNGNFDASIYQLTLGGIISSNSNARTIALGSNTHTLNGATPIDLSNSVNLTLTAGTSTLNCTNASPTFNGGGNSFRNVAFNSTALGTVTIAGANTFNNLSFTGLASGGLKEIAISANQAVNGTLTTTVGGTGTTRNFIRSDTIGTTRTLTCAAVASAVDTDFRDITIAGAAAPVSGTRLSDCKGNSGITFDAPKTVYWGNAAGAAWGSIGVWAPSLGGTPAATNFPLAQDTAVIPSGYPNSGQTVTVNANFNIGTIDMSGRTSNTLTLATGTTNPFVYGNWINGTGVTISGTGVMTFAGRGSQTITSASKTFTQNIIANTPGGTVTLSDAFSTNNASGFSLNGGTFNSAGYSVTSTPGGFSINTGSAKTVAMGSSTWSFPSPTSAIWTNNDPTNLTVTGSGTVSLNAASGNKTFAGGGYAYSSLTLSQGGAAPLVITGDNSFKDITNTATVATTINFGSTITRVGKFSAAGSAGNLLTVQGTSAAAPATLIFNGSVKPNTDYLNVSNVRAFSLSGTWYAGLNSINSGSLGWIFAVGVTSAAGLFFLLF